MLAATAALLGCAAEAVDSPLAGAAGTGAQPSGPAGGAAAAPTGTGAPPPATGGVAPMPTESDPPPPSGGVDPVGVFWTEVETVGSEELPWLGNLTNAKIRFVMRVEVAGTAPAHEVTLDFCQLQTEWIDPADPNNITTIGFRPDTVATFSQSIEADFSGLSVGSDVSLPSLAFLGGIDEEGTDFDEDGDGNPAVTAWVETLLGLQIEVYETITINATLDLAVADENTLEGTVDFDADAMILSSNNPIILADWPVTITPDSTEVPLTITRLEGNPGCSDLPSTISFTTVPPPPPALTPPPASTSTP